MTETAK